MAGSFRGSGSFPPNRPPDRNTFNSNPQFRPHYYQEASEERNFQGNYLARPPNSTRYGSSQDARCQADKMGYGNETQTNNYQDSLSSENCVIRSQNSRPSNLSIPQPRQNHHDFTSSPDHFGPYMRNDQEFDGRTHSFHDGQCNRPLQGIPQIRNSPFNSPFQGGPLRMMLPPGMPPLLLGPQEFSPNIPPPRFGFTGPPPGPTPLSASQMPPGQTPMIPGQTSVPLGQAPMPLEQVPMLPGQAPLSVPSSTGTTSDLEEGEILKNEDRKWVEEFLKGIAPTSNTDQHATETKLVEARNTLQKWNHLLKQLKAQRDKLIDCVQGSVSEWQKEVERANKLKVMLQETERRLGEKEVQELTEKWKRRKRKQEWLKRRKIKRTLEKQAAEKRRLQLHQQIDEWREKEIAKDQAKIKAANVKREAGGVLGDVRKKKSDASKALELIKALRKLRQFRKQEAELKGLSRISSMGNVWITISFELKIRKCLSKANARAQPRV
ncbi:programmed cell death protein 7 isoform X3 [Nematostella vectensis]|uniref:programmed cell death protein 7 isoform X3 n=1 Tax=Nematostella vectensis TaxID=45351 RepID=UPI0020777425|nr:programmed cell death protein 7 isoform X3 [Nematostella vectensis]